MAKAIKCDRCGKFQLGHGNDVRIPSTKTMSFVEERTLCQKCFDDLKRWYFEEK